MTIDKEIVFFDLIDVNWERKELLVTLGSIVEQNKKLKLPLNFKRRYGTSDLTNEISLKLDDYTRVYTMATDEQMAEYFPDLFQDERMAV